MLFPEISDGVATRIVVGLVLDILDLVAHVEKVVTFEPIVPRRRPPRDPPRSPNRPSRPSQAPRILVFASGRVGDYRNSKNLLVIISISKTMRRLNKDDHRQ